MSDSSHLSFIQACIRLGEIALERGDPPVGSILVLEGKIIGQGIEAGKTGKDIRRHAEMEALQDAVQKGYLPGQGPFTLYTSHEPCLMCSYMIRHYQISKIVFGVAVPHIGGYSSELNVLQTESVPHWGPAPQVLGGVGESACRALSLAYEKRKK